MMQQCGGVGKTVSSTSGRSLRSILPLHYDGMEITEDDAGVAMESSEEIVRSPGDIARCWSDIFFFIVSDVYRLDRCCLWKRKLVL